MGPNLLCEVERFYSCTRHGAAGDNMDTHDQRAWVDKMYLRTVLSRCTRIDCSCLGDDTLFYIGRDHRCYETVTVRTVVDVSHVWRASFCAGEGSIPTKTTLHLPRVSFTCKCLSRSTVLSASSTYCHWSSEQAEHGFQALKNSKGQTW